MTITMRGTRGSIPTDGEAYRIYGGATSCVSVSFGDTLLFLDAGSGIVGAPVPGSKQVCLLLSHLHLDHLIGLPMYGGLFTPGVRVEIYAKDRNGIAAKDAMYALFRPPYWPVGLQDFAAEVRYRDVEEDFEVGGLHISSMEGSHPGGSTIYRIANGQSSFVYATDFEINAAAEERLIRFSEGTELLIYDGQYTEEEYPSHIGFGHSTPSAGIRIAKAAGAKRVLFTHHSPEHTDKMLAAWEEAPKKEYPFASFARTGMSITL